MRRSYGRTGGNDMTNSMAMGITKPAGNLQDHQDRKTNQQVKCIPMHPIRRRSQKVDYLLVVESDERGNNTNTDESDIAP
jgi:hypothetical protein